MNKLKFCLISILIFCLSFITSNYSFKADEVGTTYEFNYKGSYEKWIVPENGLYRVELWGAQGGFANNTGGLGAYTAGSIYLIKGTELYIYVGQKRNGTSTTFNGGTPSGGGTSGGGATDIRLKSGDWNNFDSLKSRIMVAAGGGSGSGGKTGAGGGLIGKLGGFNNPGTQTSGGSSYQNLYVAGGFGFAGGGCSGGSGYYGAGGAACSSGSSGGSSFISGHFGCDGVDEASTSNNIIHTGQENHYSGYTFKDTVMIDGDGFAWTDSIAEESTGMPTWDGTETMTGNANNGYAKITLLQTSQIKNLIVENAEVRKIDSLNYNVYIDDESLETNITAEISSGCDYILGLGKVTLQANTKHRIVVVDSSGSIEIIILNIYQKPEEVYINFEEYEIDFNYYVNNYDIEIDFDIDSLTPQITTPDGVTYEVIGNTNLRVGNNKVIIKIKKANKETVYTFNVKRDVSETAEPGIFPYTGKVQTYVVPSTGYYMIELWGASGTGTAYGGYTKGKIHLEKGTTLYIYVGQKFIKSSNASGFNSGSATNTGYSGGGATDVRLVGGNWKDFNSLKTRIMVAGGGGTATTGTPGAGGGLVGYNGKTAKGGSQTEGGAGDTAGRVGHFGYAYGGTAAGNGYYAGGGAGFAGGSGGGSSFISGHDGCDAITEDSTETNIIHTGSPNHYSNYVFTETVMIDGMGYEWTNVKGTKINMPTFDGTSTMVGNNTNGYAIIYSLGEQDPNNNLESILLTDENDNPLKDMDGNNINLEFSPEITEYNITVHEDEIKIKIDAFQDNKDAMVVGLGTFEIPAGNTSFDITVTATNGEVKVYTINVTRMISSNPFLKGFKINGEEYEFFEENKFDYEITLPYQLNAVLVEAIKSNELQTVTGDGVQILLHNEAEAKILVVSEDGHNNKLYTIKFKKEKTTLLNKVTIKEENITIKFEPDKFIYEVEINPLHHTLNLDILPYYEGVNITIEGNKYIGESSKTITITSELEGEPTSTYTINIKFLTQVKEETFDFPYTGDVQTFIAPVSASYDIELWGGYGDKTAYGAYTKGSIFLEKGTKLYVYVGAKTIKKANATGFNAGTANSSGYSGGGATDVRLVEGHWKDFDSLKTRIMVAAGGGTATSGTPGAGGGLIGYNGGKVVKGGTQTSGGAGDSANRKGHFGYALGGTGGGNGYYAGGGAGFVTGAGGGSSYISGHKGVNSIAESSTETNIIHTGETNHYSGYVLKDTIMIDGKGYSWTDEIGGQELMPNPDGGYYSSGTGNNKDGYGRIKLAEVVPNDNYLDSITITSGETEITLDKAFAPWEQEYTVELTKEQSKIKIDAVPKDVQATVEGIGNIEIPPLESDVEITVTAQDGSVRIYTLHFKREADDDPYPTNIELKRLPNYLCKINTKYCDYTFEQTTTEYTVELPYGIREIELEVTPKSKWQEYKYYKEYDFDNPENNTPLETGNVFELTEETTTIYVEVISEDNASNVVYTYILKRDVTGNNNLESITITNPDIEIENFNPYTYEYYITLPTGFAFDIEAVPERKENTKVEIQGQIMTTDPYKTTVTNLRQGMNTVIITVTAENKDTKTYILHVYKGYESDVLLNNLSVIGNDGELELTPTFDGRINDYSISVGSSVETVTIQGLAHDPSGTTVEGLDTHTLKSGINTFEITVTSKTLNDNGEYDKNTYKVTIYKDMSNNANISNITVDGYTLDPIYNKDTHEYYIYLNNEETSLKVNVTMEHSNGTYTVRGNNNLNKAVNEIVVTGIAEDKTYVVYKIYAIKEISDNNNLQTIKYKTDFTETGVFKEIENFNKEEVNYEIRVSSETRKIEIDAEKEHISAEIKGLGIYYLNSGSNIVSITVTAENNDTKTYVINVIREKDTNTELLKVENNQGSEVTLLDEETYLINVQYEINTIEINGYALKDTSVVTGNGIYNLTPGENTVMLRVTSEAGTFKDYNVKIIRDLSNNDDLSFLYVEEGGLTPTFNETTIYYEILVPYEIDNMNKLHIEAVPEDKDATYIIENNGGTLEVGKPKTFTVTVTAPNKNTKTYTVSVTRQESTIENLSLLTLETNRGELTPTFNPDTQNYELTVENNITDITVTGEAVDTENVIVQGNGTYKLKVGKNGISVFVISKETGIQRDYQIVVTRKKSNDATLSSLVVKSHVLSPAFNKEITEYSLTTSKEYLEFTTIKPTEEEATYIIENNHSFKTGINEVKIIVTAPDGETTKEYIIKVTKTGSKNNNLSLLEVIGYNLTPIFHKGVTFYTVEVPNNINSIMIKAVAEDITSTITGDGLKTVTTGENYFDVVVTSESNTQKTYTILVTKEASDNNYLSSLLSTEGVWDKEFIKTENEYEITVENIIDEIEFYGTLEDANSIVTGLEKYKLKEGENNIEITVISESGNINVYKIKVIRKSVISAYLETLEIKEYDLDPEFNKEILEYFVTVNNETTSLDLTYTLEDLNATSEITGNENFVVGMNEIHIKVTREVDENNIMENEYIIYVNRQMSTNNYLSSLYLSEGGLNPEFNKETLNYKVTVNSSVEEITVYGTAEDIASKITSGLGVHKLNFGKNIINIKVRSSVGVTRTYTIEITREESNNNKLENITVKNIKGDVLLPNIEFNKDVVEYEYILSESEEYILIEVTKGDKYQTVAGTGPKELKPGLNTYEIVVTAQNGDVNIYKIKITNPLSNNNNAIMIRPSSGELSPEFNKDTLTYNLELDNVSSLSFEVTTESALSKVEGNKVEPVPEGTSQRKITITAEDGSKKEYIINITRASISNALLETLEIEGYPFDFNSNTFTYNIQVSRSKNKLTEAEIKAIAKDPEATINLMGDLELTIDIINVYRIEVIAKDGYTTQEYILNITRDSEEYTLRSNVYDIIRKDGKIDETEIIQISEDYCIGILPATTKNDFENNFENDQELLHTYDLEGNELEDYAGTSMKITLEKDGYKYDELIIIVRGDITNDGKVNIADYTKLNGYLAGVTKINNYQKLAGDITLDGKLNIADYTKLNGYLAGVIKEINKKPESN